MSVLVACQGGGGGGGPDGGGVTGPTAAFTAPSTVVAGTPVAFDASTSKSGDGSVLLYAWDFGEGRRGGGKTIAQSFLTPGPHAVGLTVVDGRRQTSTVQHTVTVSAPPPPSRTATVQGKVQAAGSPLSGVTVTVVGGSSIGSTDALGSVQLELPVDAPLTLQLQKDGYADQFLPLTLPASVGADGYFEATLVARDAALTLTDAAVGGTLVGRDGATLVLAPSSLVDGSGAAVSGEVQISLTPVDVTTPGAAGFPGQFAGVAPDASITSIVSLGTTEFIPTRGGQRLQLAPGKTASIDLPLYANSRLEGALLSPGDTIPLWSLDEQSGLWIQEGQGTVVAAPGAPTGMALRATVAHLSWWNADLGFDPYGPRPKCVYDTDLDIPGGEDQFATATVCNMLADIDRPGGGSPLKAERARLSRATSPAAPRLPGFSRTATLPIAGGVRIAVPANTNIALHASALNGTWFGKAVVNGPVGVEADELIKMRPIAVGGTGDPITLPYDATASLQTGQVARYTFAGEASKWARITVSQGVASDLVGTVRLLQGATELGTAIFGVPPGQLIRPLTSAGPFTIEVTGTANTPGAFRLQVELLGGIREVPLELPFDATDGAPQYTLYRASFTSTAGTGLVLALQRRSTGTLVWRLRSASGATLFDVQVPLTPYETRSLVLPTTGQYFLEVVGQDGQAVDFRVTGEQTSWIALAAPNVTLTSTYNLVDLITDRNGAPVLVYVQNGSAGGFQTQSVSLQRWNGTAWTPVAADLPFYPRPCQGALGVNATFDLENRPLVVYGDFNEGPGGHSKLNIRRYASGAWETVGPDAGVLPQDSVFGSTCSAQPVVRVGADDAPLVAYAGDNTLWVQKLVGNQWVGLVTPGGDAFPVINGGMDLAVDPSGRPVFAWTGTSGNFAPTVYRLRTSPSVAWEPLGPNGGLIPIPASTRELNTPKIRFDATGNPVIGSMAAVYTSPGVFTGGTAVTRFDGATWQGMGGYRISDDSFSNSAPDMGFTLFEGDGVMGWVNARQGGFVAPVVQRNTPVGWSAIGLDDGRIPQVTPHGLIDTSAGSLRPLAVGSELYLALVERVPVSGNSVQQVQVLRYLH